MTTATKFVLTKINTRLESLYTCTSKKTIMHAAANAFTTSERNYSTPNT